MASVFLSIDTLPLPVEVLLMYSRGISFCCFFNVIFNYITWIRHHSRWYQSRSKAPSTGANPGWFSQRQKHNRP